MYFEFDQVCVGRHGMEPVVNLMYSDKGSTASRISLSVADEVNRGTVAPQMQGTIFDTYYSKT